MQAIWPSKKWNVRKHFFIFCRLFFSVSNVSVLVHSDGEKDLGPIVASLSLGSPAIMKFRPVPSKWMSDDGQLKEGRKTPPVVIELTLRHGDTLVMEGAEIQEYYQVRKTSKTVLRK